MVASPKKVSSSCSQIPARQSYNARNSEVGNLMRRSFSDNPFSKPSIIPNPRVQGFGTNTPANSPADNLKRNSISKEALVSNFEDKENGKDPNLKLLRVRSPAASHPKGTKNFMSPTISAASKVNPSPRKKVLAERNESNRPSVSFSDVVTLIMDDTEKTPQKPNNYESIMGLNQNDSYDATITDSTMGLNQSNKSYDMTITDLDSADDYKKDGGPMVSDESLQEPTLSEDPTIKVSPDSAKFAPVDPSIAAYDPKTNYLSPRPQFRHYRPNARSEWQDQLDNISSSESFSDTEDETQSMDERQVLSENKIQSIVEQTQSDDDRQVLSESENEIESEVEQTQSEVDTVKEAKIVSKPGIFRRLKFVAFIFILVIGCFSISLTCSPGVGSSLLTELSLYEYYVPPRIADFVSNPNFGQVGETMKLWSDRSLSYIYKLISSMGGVQNLGDPLQYANLTNLLEESFDAYLPFDPSHLQPIKEVETQKLEVEIENEHGKQENIADANNLMFSEEHEDASEPEELHQLLHQEIEAISSSEERLVHETEADAEIDTIANTEEQQTEVDADVENHNQIDTISSSEEQSVHESEADAEIDTTANVEEQQQIEQETEADADVEQRKQIEALLEEQQKIDTINYADAEVVLEEQEKTVAEVIDVHSVSEDNSKAAETQLEESKLEEPLSNKNVKIPDKLDIMLDDLRTKLLAMQVMSILSVVLSSALAAATMFYIMTRKPSTPLPPPTAAVSIENPPSPLNRKNEVDMGLASGTSSSDQDGVTEPRETFSKKNDNRESLASSSGGYSISMDESYGSFTTYQKIPKKRAHGEEDVMITPVRRSSRVRNKVTSS